MSTEEEDLVQALSETQDLAYSLVNEIHASGFEDKDVLRALENVLVFWLSSLPHDRRRQLADNSRL